jgi:2-polyprenyl-6-methoxyphenol hydroxylase-like FAD-dependent oxidoreductase
VRSRSHGAVADGGPTADYNLGPAHRGHHNDHTHHGWRVEQPEPGRFVWIAPTGHRYDMDIAGYCPTGPHTLYAYLVEEAQDHFADTPEQKVTTMRELAAAYHGPWDAIREDITDADRINYTLFEHLLVEGPWNRGRAMILGDAAHTCPPTLALGAAMALEDAAVLAELLLTRDRLDQDLFDAFLQRRLDRAKTVVDGSMQLAHWLLEHKTDADVPGLMARINAVVSEPA